MPRTRAFAAGEWFVLSDAPAGTTVPIETERYLATRDPVECRP